METRKYLLVMTLALMTSRTCFTQSKDRNPGALLARLSYRSTYGVEWREQEGFPQICFALYRGRYYRLSRLAESGPQAFHGTLSSDQISRISRILKNLDSPNQEGGIVRQGSESVVVEMAGRAKRYSWSNADHRNPFPDSVVELVKWLQDFKVGDASAFTLRDLSDKPICPPASVKSLQPTVAGLNAPSEAVGCGGPHP